MKGGINSSTRSLVFYGLVTIFSTDSSFAKSEWLSWKNYNILKRFFIHVDLTQHQSYSLIRQSRFEIQSYVKNLP